MRIIIAGDFSLQGRVAKCNDLDVLKYLMGGVRKSIKSDYAIVNFESPIATPYCKPIIKDGPVLMNPVEAIEVLKDVGFNVFTLANNHLKDFGEEGVKNTLTVCKEMGVHTVGAGVNIDEARKPLILSDNVSGYKVGILNVCEHESSVATSSNAGANPLDLVSLYYDIRNLKKSVDKLVVVIHGGCEHYQLPTPRMKRVYHLIADYGADVIVNHHQHCYSGYETYNGTPIFYGLGNFFFDNPKKRRDKWNEGLLLKLDVQNDDIQFELIPYNQCDDDPVIKIREYGDVKDKIEELNAIIADDNLLNEHFDRLVASKKPLRPFLPYGNHYLRALYHRGLFPSFLNNKRKVMMQNAVRCESHREVFLSYLEHAFQNK